MKDKIIKILLINLLFLTLALRILSDDVLIPQKKPIISEKTLEVLNNAKPSEKTIKLDRNQPEFKLTFQKYKSKVVSDYRLNKAKIEYKKNKPIFCQLKNFCISFNLED